MRQKLHPDIQGPDDVVAGLATSLKHHEARNRFDKRGDMAASDSAQQGAFPVAGSRAVLDLWRGAGIYAASTLRPRLCPVVPGVQPLRMILRLRKWAGRS